MDALIRGHGGLPLSPDHVWKAFTQRVDRLAQRSGSDRFERISLKDDRIPANPLDAVLDAPL